jgi:tRNA modification GTPase
MLFPSLNDTIVAVSTAWEATPLAIVRLSGSASFELACCLGAAPPQCQSERFPLWTFSQLSLDKELTIPAYLFWFRGPRSYTGQDLLEFHVPGCLPLVRELCARLIELGARRALPGEFTARAYLNGKLGVQEVDNVLALMSAGQRADELARGRKRSKQRQRLRQQIVEGLENLLARVEAGIDFSDEEDVRIITAEQVRAALAQTACLVKAARQEPPLSLRAGKPHVALAGLANAGKSTLFNALVGFERAIVSPVLGTTRDVISAEVQIDGVRLILQDCAGLHDRPDELELAAHLAAERAAAQADLVLWVHVHGLPWSERELEALGRIEPGRRVLVLSKADLWPGSTALATHKKFVDSVVVSAVTGAGLSELRAVICRRLAESVPEPLLVGERDWARVAGVLDRALAIAAKAGADGSIDFPELLALELREALNIVSETAPGNIPELVLERIYSQFCVGK